MSFNQGKLKDKLNKVFGRSLPNDVQDIAFNQVYRNEHKRPKLATDHVGIEVECYTYTKEQDLKKIIYTNDLENYVNVGNDNSIRPPNTKYSKFELRILIPEAELKTVFPRLKNAFAEASLKVNESCGLHVHLDMRNRDLTKCFNRLCAFQDVLFGLVDPDRWKNRYCYYTTNTNKNERYLAINKSSYRKHKTLEVRLHHGTVNIRKIEKWVGLLLNIINSKSPIPQFTSKTEILKWKGLRQSLRNYIRVNFNDNWFLEKSRAIKYSNDGYLRLLEERGEETDDIEWQDEENEFRTNW